MKKLVNFRKNTKTNTKKLSSKRKKTPGKKIDLSGLVKNTSKTLKKLKLGKLQIILKRINLKITHGLILLLLISIVALAGIAFNTTISMNEMKGSIDNIYEKSVVQLTEIAKLQSTFGQLRYHINISLHEADSELVDKKIRADIQAYNSSRKYIERLEFDDKKIMYLDTIDSAYQEYVGTWEEIKGKNQTVIYAKTEKRLKALEDNFNSAVDGIINLDNIYASGMKRDSEALFRKNSKTLQTVFVISILSIISIIAFLIVFIRSILKATTESLYTIAEGDLTKEITCNKKNEFTPMLNGMEKMRKALTNTLSSVDHTTESSEETSKDLAQISNTMSQSAEQVSLAIQDISSKSMSQLNDVNLMTEQADALDEILSAITEIAADVKNNATDTGHMAEASSQDIQATADTIPEILESFKTVTIKIRELKDQILSVSDVLSFINKVAEQTSLLALNARIEAARAGEHGRGFTVVASEIGKLSNETKASATIINEKIKEISDNATLMNEISSNSSQDLENRMTGISQSLASFETTINAFNAIVPKIETIYGYIADANDKKAVVIDTSNHIRVMVDESTGLIEEVSAYSEELAASSEHVAQLSDELKDKSDEIRDQLRFFKINDQE